MQSQSQKLEEKFGMPVIDATTATTIVIKTRELRRGKPRDGEKCAIALAVHRQLGGKANIGKDIAFVEMPDGRGGRHMVRYRLSGPAARLVRANDLGEAIDGKEVTVDLVPPPPSHRLDAARTRMRKHRATSTSAPVPRRKRGEGSYEQRAVRDFRGQL